MLEENEGVREQYFDDDGKLVKHELYDGDITADHLGMVSHSETMGELRERLVPDDPLDKLDRVIFPIAAIGVAFGLSLIIANI